MPALDLRSLEIFIAVAEATSMTAAAARLQLSQSAVSQAIKQLEDGIGVRLVDRTVRPARLTEAGHDLYTRGCRILAEAGETANAVRRAANVGPASLRIGLVDSFAASVGPGLAHHLRADGSGCQLLSGQSAMHAQALRNRELDLVVTSDETLIDEPAFAVEPLLTEPIVMAIPADYRSGRLDLSDLTNDLELVRYTERAAIGRQIALYLNRLRLAPASTLSFDSSDAVLAMVGAGLGFALTTPLCVLQARSQLDNVRLEPLPPPGLVRHLSIGRHRGELAELAGKIAQVSDDTLRATALPRIGRIGSWMTREIVLASGSTTRRD